MMITVAEGSLWLESRVIRSVTRLFSVVNGGAARKNAANKKLMSKPVATIFGVGLFKIFSFGIDGISEKKPI